MYSLKCNTIKTQIYFLIFSFVTESASHMTGSTHMDIEVDNEKDVSTREPETETNPGNKDNLESNIYDTTRRPNIIIAELFSRNSLVVTFDVIIDGPKECIPQLEIKPSKKPRQIDSDESCCQKIFKDPPFLVTYGKYNSPHE